MFKEFPDDDNRNDDFLNEFRQKISDQSLDTFEERRNELKKSKTIFLGIVGGIVLACIVGWIILAPQYRIESDKEIPVIRRPQTAIRVQPNEPGGMEIPNQDKTVYNIIEKKDDQTIENLLPPPEDPKLPVIIAQEETTDSAVEPSDVLPEAQEIITKNENKSVITTEEIIQQAEQQIENPIKEEPVAEVNKDDVQVVASTEEVNIKEVTTPQPVQEISTKEEKAIVKAEIHDKPLTAIQNEAPKAAVAGNWQIQLMSSPNKAAIEKAKIDLGKKYKISHLPFEIEPAVLDMNKTFYRLKVGAFNNRAEADKLCNDIKTLGGTCIVKKK